MCERFGTTHKLYRVTAYVLKFIQLLTKQVTSPELTRQDLTLAEQLWIREFQVDVQQDKRFPMWKTQLAYFKMGEVCGDVEEDSKMWIFRVQQSILSF